MAPYEPIRVSQQFLKNSSQRDVGALLRSIAGQTFIPKYVRRGHTAEACREGPLRK